MHSEVGILTARAVFSSARVQKNKSATHKKTLLFQKCHQCANQNTSEKTETRYVGAKKVEESIPAVKTALNRQIDT